MYLYGICIKCVKSSYFFKSTASQKSKFERRIKLPLDDVKEMAISGKYVFCLSREKASKTDVISGKSRFFDSGRQTFSYMLLSPNGDEFVLEMYTPQEGYIEGRIGNMKYATYGELHTPMSFLKIKVK